MPTIEDEKIDTQNPGEADYQRKVDDFKGPENYNKTAEEPAQKTTDLAGSEKAAESKQDQSATGGPESSFYNAAAGAGVAGYSAKMLLKNRKVVGGGLGAFFVILAITVLGITSLGPLKYIHFAQMLQGFHFSDQELISSERLRNFFIYSQIAKNGNGSLEKTRLGTVEAVRANKIDKQLKASGLTSNFNNGRFTGFTFDIADLPEDHPIRQELKNVPNNELENRREVVSRYFNVDISTVDGGPGKMTISVDGTKDNRKLFSKILKASPDYNVITASYAKRILIKRANLSYNPVTRLKENTKQNLSDKYNDWREQRKARLSGDTSLNVNKPGNIDATNEDGTKPDGLDDINNANNEAGKVIDDAKAKIKLTKVASGGVALAVVSALCTVRDVSDEAAKQQTLNKIGPMMQAASETLAIGSKIQAGEDVSLETIGEFNKSLDSEEFGSWSSASSIQYEMGNDPNYSTLEDYPELKPNDSSAVSSVDNIFKEMNEISGVGATVGAVCGVFDTFSALTAPLIEALSFGLSEIISEKISEVLIGFLAGGPVDLTDPKYAGEVFGESVNVGARLMANEASASQGGRPLSSAETALLKKETAQYIANNDERSPIAAVFDLKNPTNPLAQMAVSLQAKNYEQVFKKLTSVDFLSSKVLAEEGINDSEAYYNIPKFGFDVNKLESIYNPYENANWVATNLTPDSTAVEVFEECNNIDVTDDWDFVSLSYPAGIVTDYNSLPADCLNDSDEALYRLRVLALDTITIKSFSCIEYDDEESCVEVSGQTSDVNRGEVEQGAPVVSSFGPFVFPVQASKQAIKSAGWCWQKQDVTCHGTESYGYYASDIFINEGVPIVSATNGTVVKVEQNQPNKNGSAEQTVITIRGDDCDDSGNNLTCLGEGTVFWYGHMKPGSATVSVGDRVTAGQQIALSGGIPQADGTPAHLHFDATNRKNSFRGSCARENVQACKELGFINVQPNLHSAFNAIGTTNNTAQSPNPTSLFGSYLILNKLLDAASPTRNTYVTA